MKKVTVTFICLAVALLLAGGGLVYYALSHTGFDWNKLTVVTQNETYDYAVTGAIRDVKIDTKRADVRVVQSFDGSCSVRAKVPSRDRCYAEVKDGVLTVICSYDPSAPWYMKIWRQDEMTVTVFLPGDSYDKLEIGTGSGDIYVSEAIRFTTAGTKTGSGDVEYYAPTTESLTVSASSGDVAVKRVNCQNVSVSTASGEICLQNCRADSVSVSASSGDVTFTQCTAKSIKTNTASGDVSFSQIAVSELLDVTSSSGEITYTDSASGSIRIVAKTGDVTGILNEPMQFDVRSDSGDIEVPPSGGTGRCSIRTGSGDITFTMFDSSDS